MSEMYEESNLSSCILRFFTHITQPNNPPHASYGPPLWAPRWEIKHSDADLLRRPKVMMRSAQKVDAQTSCSAQKRVHGRCTSQVPDIHRPCSPHDNQCVKKVWLICLLQANTAYPWHKQPHCVCSGVGFPPRAYGGDSFVLLFFFLGTLFYGIATLGPWKRVWLVFLTSGFYIFADGSKCNGEWTWH